MTSVDELRAVLERPDVKTRIENVFREAQIKGVLARCKNRHSREMWRGEAGLR